jgi:hypothetical protein
MLSLSSRGETPMNRTVAVLIVLALAGAVPAADANVEPSAPEPGFTALFNGKDFNGKAPTGWTVENKGQFSVKDGVIFLNRGGGWLRSNAEYKDFELRLDFRFLNKGADSGVFVRAGKEGGNWPAVNYQVQLMDDDSIGSVFKAGDLAGPKQTKDRDRLKKALKPVNEWQTLAVTARGPHLEVRLNGELINTADGLTDRAGYLGLQGEGGQLEFKNIRIKELK